MFVVYIVDEAEFVELEVAHDGHVFEHVLVASVRLARLHHQLGHLLELLGVVEGASQARMIGRLAQLHEDVSRRVLVLVQLLLLGVGALIEARRHVADEVVDLFAQALLVVFGLVARQLLGCLLAERLQLILAPL